MNDPPTPDGQIPHLSDSSLDITRDLSPDLKSQDGFSSPIFTDLSVPERIGRYVICEPIARGGMGIILKAWDELFGRNVAIKLLLNAGDDGAHAQRFKFEACVTARLQHPGIVPVYEMGVTTNAQPFFAMKLIEGRSLQTLVQENLQNTTKHLKIFEAVCHTLAYCHARGVLHLDIKPNNVMAGEFGEAHLMDWGLARDCHDEVDGNPVSFADGKNTDFSPRIQGTPAYMSPEQAKGETVSARSDVFGLGAMLCEILTGGPPYSGKGLRSTYLMATKGKVSPALAEMKSKNQNLPMVRLAEQCLSPLAEARPENAQAVANAVTAYLEAMFSEGMKDWHRFFEICPDLFCIASFDGYFLRVNGNFTKVLGYSEFELISRPFLDMVHDEDRSRTMGAMSVLLEGLPVTRFRNRYRNSVGDYVTLEWTARAVQDERIIFAVARDVSMDDATDRAQVMQA